MNATVVIDTADILMAQPIAVRPGEPIDFSVTALSVDCTPTGAAWCLRQSAVLVAWPTAYPPAR